MSGLFLTLALLPAQEAERRDMLDKVRTSVVALRNDESYGSGFILDDKGTILTNAHVIVSPLPFRVQVEAKDKNGVRSVYYNNVTLLGVHPTRDLALVRIDPSEHQLALAPLPMSKSKVVSTDRIFAVGYPNTASGGQRKVCTSGEVTGVDKYVDMPGYFEFSAEVAHGNSGGPIVDKFGHAVGVVTAGMTGGIPVAWAIPLDDFRPDQFVPLDRRPKDPAKAAKLLRLAEESLKKAKEGHVLGVLVSETLFHFALLEDISNPDTYYKIGLLQRHQSQHATASSYLMRSIQLQPWSDSKDIVYHELGVALIYLKRPKDALTIWNEAIAKFPGEAGTVWDALAVHHFDAGRYLDAACATRASLRAFGDRAAAMNSIYDKARQRLDREGIAQLTVFEKSIDDTVREDRKAAEKARQDGRRSMTSNFEQLLKSFEGVQRQAAGFNFSTLGRGPNAPKPLDIPDAELLPLFIRSRIAVAAEHLQAGRLGKARDVLEDVIKTHPDHPETETARELLDVINKK